VHKGVKIEKKIQEEEASSMDPWSLSLYGMKAPMTREKYRGRLAKFLDFIGLTDNSRIKDYAKAFTERGRKDPDWVFVTVRRFAQSPSIYVVIQVEYILLLYT
jgi:hypothetical protein